MRFVKKYWLTILLVFVFAAGLSVLLYPTVSNYVNSLVQSRAVTDYNRQVTQITDADYTASLNAAAEYNASLIRNPFRFTPTPEETKRYDSLLNVGNTGIMGVLAIPKIHVELPIYHGTGTATLQAGLGHVEGSSLPIGGPGTHAVISGHTGLPSAELLTNLDQLTLGDQFTITVLGELLTYQVDQIKVVLPDDMSDLGIVPGEDDVTLLTCTPYGINDHRLLVRGRRVANGPQTLDVRVDPGAVPVNTSPMRIIGVGTLAAAFLLYVLLQCRKRKKRGENL